MQLYHSDKIGTDGKDYMTCKDCPVLGRGQDDYPWTYFCEIMDGLIKNPSECWCKMGMTSMWMRAHAPREVVEFIVML